MILPTRNILLLLLLLGLHRADAASRFVVIYTSQDQEYAEPILRDFTRQTGVDARAVYDSEAVKTVGLSNRLLAEQNHPQCDVFWNNEEFRTRQLAGQNLFSSSNGWVSIGYRERRLAFNTRNVARSALPHSLVELTNQVWKGKIAIAYPFFGTTATHFLVLRQQWGADSWETWCRALAANKPLLVDGNSVVVQLLGRGEAQLGLTDSDDIQAGIREGLPIAAHPLPDCSLAIPNTVAVLRLAPHPAEARQLFEYLQGDSVREKLLGAGALLSKTNPPTGKSIAWTPLIADLEAATETLKKIFLR